MPPRSICTPRARRARPRTRRGRARATASPVPIETSNAPPVSSNTWRAMTRHSSVDGADPRALAGARWLMRRDVAVREEAAQLALEAIDEIEGGLRGLRRVPRRRVHGVDLEHRRHRLVREAPHLAQLARAPRSRVPRTRACVDACGRAIGSSYRPQATAPAVRLVARSRRSRQPVAVATIVAARASSPAGSCAGRTGWPPACW